ncbi:hypothetical protein A1O7_07630 [Cladophialophora yegresii CBS 114405]|uniref:BTB domain-containing protein n=1 Tax=Cladophialophora yegresii CBS 114405 TaxID=1182544 RepID=W9VP05_9EURO|nr:uncharacterized protein A1O7_07630 [Cladophialophora yegresii CBS 114405]EXJ57283.1 hypothetical protein A1O7_07630 [Cladophialophora yegresii CBS 114405]
MASSSFTSHRLKRKADEMESEFQKQPRFVDISPEGKVLFKIGKGDAARTIRVAAPLICQVAPVFTELLSSASIEGSDKVSTVEDGSPDAYLDFFNIVHYKHSEIGHLTGQRLSQLAELASRLCCREVFKAFIVDRLYPVIQEIRNESIHPTITRTVLNALEQYEVTFEELLDIAAFCKMDELFWRTSYINVARKNAVVNFLSGVFDYLHDGHLTTPDSEDAHGTPTTYGILHDLFRKEGIVAHRIWEYEGTLVQAMALVRRVAYLEE